MIKEIERRCESGENGGGPYSITAVAADMLIEENGETQRRGTSGLGELDEELTIEKTGSDLHIGFNPHFLMDALKVIPDEMVHISFNSRKSPCKLSDAEESYMYLILPVNIG